MISALSLMLMTGVVVETQHLSVSLDPPRHTVAVQSEMRLGGAGELRVELASTARIGALRVDGERFEPRWIGGADDAVSRLAVDVPAGARSLSIAYEAEFNQPVSAGERPGEIHNFSVDAHVGDEGVFLSDGSAWHPRPIDGSGHPMLHRVETRIAPLEGWAFVASGDPVGDGDLQAPRWNWSTPRPVDGVAIAGNRHRLHGVVHSTSHGPVEIVMHVPESHAKLAPMFVEAAREYLDLYVPLLGAFPYRRFSIVENFFSSGFAYPGFTLLGPRVVGMAPRSLAPGYLDHELVHNWWGNGVYVDRAEGNWCEGLTSFCANYYRRIADEGPEAGRAYRRGVLMKLSTDPETLDDGALAAFGSADPSQPGPGRFVGYDKGAFVFAMLARVLSEQPEDVGPLFSALKRFAAEHLGSRAGWSDLRRAFEAERPDLPAGWLAGFFETWVYDHVVPRTVALRAGDTRPDAFAAQYDRAGQAVEILMHAGSGMCEIDPEFRLYRVLPPAQLVPTIAGTLGRGGVRVVADRSRPEVSGLLRQVEADDAGENLLLIGEEAVRRHGELIERTSDPITVTDGAFTVGNATHDHDDQAVLHTMAHPDEPGRYVTVFIANGDAGWSRLRLIRFYTRDSTIVWSGEQVQDRRVHEPDRRVPMRD